MTETIRLATRGSDLALRQAQQVANALEARRREVLTAGDLACGLAVVLGVELHAPAAVLAERVNAKVVLSE